MPIAVVMTVRFGWVTVAQLKEARGYVVVGAFVIGAIFTPPDIISQFMLAMPIWLLFELGLVVACSPTKQAPEQTILPPLTLLVIAIMLVLILLSHWFRSFTN